MPTQTLTPPTPPSNIHVKVITEVEDDRERGGGQRRVWYRKKLAKYAVHIPDDEEDTEYEQHPGRWIFAATQEHAVDIMRASGRTDVSLFDIHNALSRSRTASKACEFRFKGASVHRL